MKCDFRGAIGVALASSGSLPPQRKWGPALLPAPTAPSEGYAGVRNLVKTLRPRPALDPGSPAQASFPIEQLPLARSPTGLPDCAARGFAGPSTCPACLELDPKTDFAAKTVRCSTALLGSTTLASRFAHHDPQGTARTASRLRKIDSSGASYQLTPKRTRRCFLLPAGGDRTFGRLPRFPAVAGWSARPGPPSRSQLQHARLRRVAKAKNGVRSLWITGISGTTRGTFSDSPESPGLGCRSVPLRLLPASA
jgi:hypothetical protein